MQNKTRILILILACVIFVYIGELTLTKAFSPAIQVSSAVVVTDQNDRHPAAVPTIDASSEKNHVVSNSSNDYIVKNYEDNFSQIIPVSSRDKYVFTTYATGNGNILLAGHASADKNTGIIYYMKPDMSGLNPDTKEYAFPEKGAITFNASEDNGDIITFSCGNGEHGYFETIKGIVVFDNYYLNELRENPYFDREIYDFQELKQSEVHLTKEEAIDMAVRKASVGGILGKSRKTSAVLVKYTNKKEPELPGTNVVLKDCPAWVVTFSGVDENSSGVEPTGGSSGNSNEQNLKDFHIFIGANSGIWLGSMSHPSLLKF